MPFLTILTIAVMVFALVDIIVRPDDEVKHLPKLVWVILVVILPIVGSIVWFVAGREYAGGGISMRRMQRQAPPVQAQQWAPPPAHNIDTRTTEQQIADLDREIEEWRLREEIAKKERERGEAGTE